MRTPLPKMNTALVPTSITPKNSTTPVPISIVVGGYTEVVHWYRFVEKELKQSKREDSHWNWPRRFFGANLWAAATNRRAVSLQICVASPAGESVPIAQMLVVLPYHWPGDFQPGQSALKGAFLWLLSKTPPNALKSKGITADFPVTKAAIDAVVALSSGSGLGGRIGLHAATYSLVSRYRKDANMSVRPILQKTSKGMLPRHKFISLVRVNTGRYCYLP